MYYQYLSSENAIANIERRMVKVSRIKTVNDIFELQPYLRLEQTKRKQFGIIRKEVSDTYGMACFSADWQEPIMWGHYADRNRGIVLGFEFKSDKYNMKAVEYPAKRIKIALNPEKITPSEYIEAVGFIKYKGWSYEKEHRFFIELNECVCIERNYFMPFGDDLCLKQVIIGPQHPSKDKDQYIQTARYIAKLVKMSEAALIVTRAEFGGYKVVRCGRWTPKFQMLLNLKQ